jgi:rhodanese-related sulfurtransferase
MPTSNGSADPDWNPRPIDLRNETRVLSLRRKRTVMELKEDVMPKGAMDMVADAKRDLEKLTPEQVEAEVKNGATLVDLRDSAELAEKGSIPGSIHVPRGMLEFNADPSTPYHKPELDPSKRVILHCQSGGRSALAAKTLKELGYTNVAHLEGGMNAWNEAGKPKKS